jgi:hypothetical protein
MQPLVSIVIPATTRSVRVKSTLAQMWPCREGIAANDGSKDNTLAVARNLASAEVKVVTQQNQGAAAGRNHLFALAQGDSNGSTRTICFRRRKCRCNSRWQKKTAHAHCFSCGWGLSQVPSTQAYIRSVAALGKFAATGIAVAKWEGNLFIQPASWLTSRELSVAAGAWNTEFSGDDDRE